MKNRPTQFRIIREVLRSTKTIGITYTEVADRLGIGRDQVVRAFLPYHNRKVNKWVAGK